MMRPSTKHGQDLRACVSSALLDAYCSFTNPQLDSAHVSALDPFPPRQVNGRFPASTESGSMSCCRFLSLEARTPNRGSEDLAYPYTLFASKFAPAATSAETHLSLPFQAAECSGVCHSSSMAFTFAPFARRKRTMSVWPRYAAACSGDSLPAMGSQTKEAQQRCKR